MLNVIADRYNAKFTQYDLFTGEFQNYSLTHRQKMLIGQYLAEGYVTSQEMIDLIENHVPVDCESPLAYLLKSLENLKRERLYEQKEIAHRNAKNYYAMRQQEVIADEC
ncbi:replication initiator protein A [Streptococcus gallolyticus subsp. gallolyticus ATCC BAA-2069]|nr:GP49 bacteriophage-like protein [Streptococcus gallolyticus subsp. gallolyticus ATCC BAA-2069]CBZ49236.1 replication initiator protein A [Streptococcus gallolyticus subsp. gallolyticus ATCC BAA-2069]